MLDNSGIYLLVIRLSGPPQLQLRGNGAYLIYIGKAGSFDPITGVGSSTLAYRIHQLK